MTHIERILYANFPGHGFIRRSSPKINQWLDQTSLTKLMRQGCTEPTTTWTTLNGNKIARTYMEPRRDEYGRKTIYNFTIIMTIQDLLELLNADAKTDQYLIKSMASPPDHLEALDV